MFLSCSSSCVWSNSVLTQFIRSESACLHCSTSNVSFIISASGRSTVEESHRLLLPVRWCHVHISPVNGESTGHSSCFRGNTSVFTSSSLSRPRSGTFSLWCHPKFEDRCHSVVEFIERAIMHSKNGKFLYFLRSRVPGNNRPITSHLSVLYLCVCVWPFYYWLNRTISLLISQFVCNMLNLFDSTPNFQISGMRQTKHLIYTTEKLEPTSLIISDLKMTKTTDYQVAEVDERRSSFAGIIVTRYLYCFTFSPNFSASYYFGLTALC